LPAQPQVPHPNLDPQNFQQHLPCTYLGTGESRTTPVFLGALAIGRHSDSIFLCMIAGLLSGTRWHGIYPPLARMTSVGSSPVSVPMKAQLESRPKTTVSIFPRLSCASRFARSVIMGFRGLKPW
jgi:hypothetical protein